MSSLFRTAAIACVLTAVPAIAAAQTIPELDVSAGYLATTDHNSSLAGIATLHGPGIGLPGIHPQVSLAIPFTSGGRFAATAEGAARLPGGFFAGGGLGLGRLDQPLSTGALYDLFAGKSVAPHVDVIGRYYAGFDHTTGQALFAGVALRL